MADGATGERGQEDAGTPKRSDAALVVGGGVGGIRAALDLAEMGYRVCLVERRAYLGGALVQLDKWFPTNDCGFCRLLPSMAREGAGEFCLRRELVHPGVEVLTSSELEGLAGEAGAFVATVVRAPRYVDQAKCIGCGLCVEVCPEETDNPFDKGQTRHRAIHLSHPNATANRYVIDSDACTRCGECMKVCPTGAIDLDAGEETLELPVGAVILDPGFQEFDPGRLTQYGYGTLANVVTSLDLERLISPTGRELLSGAGGDEKAKLVRPSNGAPAKRVAFLQCVGSRDSERPYCSTACCMYALKEAILLTELDPQIVPHIFFMDMRAYGKGYHRYYERAVEEGRIQFTRCRVPAVSRDSATGDLLLTYETEEGALERDAFDLVVLSVGQVQPQSTRDLAGALGIDLDTFGFSAPVGFSSTTTNREGVFVCGSFTAPSDIPRAVVEASAAASGASAILSRGRARPSAAAAAEPGPAAREEEAGEAGKEGAKASEREGIAVFLCRCGEQLEKVLDFAALRKGVEGLPGILCVEEVPYLCLSSGLEDLQKKIAESRAERVLIGACTPNPYRLLVEEQAARAGVDRGLVEWVNYREGDAWVHPESGPATEKAKDLLAMGYERLRLEEVMPRGPAQVSGRFLVVGGGMAGIAAALSLAEQGYQLDLAERTGELGGNAREIAPLPEEPDPKAAVREMVEKVEASGRITVWRNTEVTGVRGQLGRFRAGFRSTGGSGDVPPADAEYGAVIMATGASEHEPAAYLFGKSDRVLTQRMLARRLAEDEGALDAGTVVMIQCVESREGERPYCSRICCTHAVRHAMEIRRRSPETTVYILYRDMMLYGLREHYYGEAREKGVVFLRYDVDEKPSVELEDGALVVRLRDRLLGADLALGPDILVLSTGVDPHSVPGELVETTKDGFVAEANVKFRPLELVREGMLACGLAQSPGSLDESISSGRAAASRAAAMLERMREAPPRLVSEVHRRWCSGCGLCVEGCPFGARTIDPEEKVAVVSESICQGCGVCATLCPNGAAKLRRYRENQLFAMLDAVL